MNWQPIIDDVRQGVKVLAPQPYHRCAHDVGMEIVREHRDMAFYSQGLFVRHPSGGFIHLAVRDDQVYGREYHRMVGYGSEVMRSRVRLPYQPKTLSTYPLTEGV